MSLIDRYNREYVVKIYVSIGIISMVLPANQLNLSDEISGITMLINGNTANLSGRILCITNVKVKEVP